MSEEKKGFFSRLKAGLTKTRSVQEILDKAKNLKQKK